MKTIRAGGMKSVLRRGVILQRWKRAAHAKTAGREARSIKHQLTPTHHIVLPK
jgi:hypothetical protein